MGWRVKGVLFAILVLGTWLRLKGVTNPLLDDQAWRQADTASMALNMLGHLGNVPDVLFPLLNYDGVGPQKVELEFPFLPYILALTWRIFGWADFWGRIWAIVFSFFTLYGVFQFGRLWISERVGLWASALYALLPLTTYYGRVIMPEPIAQAFSIWALYAILLWRKSPSLRNFFSAALLMAAAILAKLPQLMIFPAALAIGFWPLRGRLLKMLQYCLLALFLPMLYYTWVHIGAGAESQFVSGILSNQVVEGSNTFMKELKMNLRQGIGLPVVFIAGAGFIRLLWDGLNPKYDSFHSQQKNKGVLLGVGLWFIISWIYLGAICLRIPLDYYLVPVALPFVLCTAFALDSLDDIPGFVIGLLVVSLLLLNQVLVYAPKYSWDERYLSQAIWIREHVDKEQSLVLSDTPPMTFYYSQRYGFRLKNPDDQKAWEELKVTPGEYLVALPGSRGKDFWQKVEAVYPQVGPGVYRRTHK
jgi:hypothetical protein